MQQTFLQLADLPSSVREIAEVIGIEQAMTLINQLPTCRAGVPGHQSTRPILYVPARLSADHRLAKILGWDDASRLVEAFGGEILYPANCANVLRSIRSRYASEMLALGYSRGTVAEVLGMAERNISKLTAQPQEASRLDGRKNDQLF